MISIWIFFAVVATIVILIHLLGAWVLAMNKENAPAGIIEEPYFIRERAKATVVLSGEPDHFSLPEEEKLPEVAILIAARNEENNLERCLHALEQLNYPKELLTIWIGNDSSSDATLEVAQKLCRGKVNFFVLDIKGQWEGLKGKANVLAQLARAAGDRADYFFITDADVAVVPDWVRNMLLYFTPEVAMVNGTTLVEGSHWRGRMQRYDWLLSLGLAKAFSLLPWIGKTLTATGNNLAIRKSAYEAVGGYEAIPFSVTEDFELHRQLCAIGFKTYHSTSAGTKAFTRPTVKFSDLLHQRKRWMTGAMQLPQPMVLMLFFQALFFPSVLVVIFYQPLFGILLLLFKLVFQLVLAWQMSRRLKEPVVGPFLVYELYSFLLNTCLLIFWFLPIKVEWKGRRY